MDVELSSANEWISGADLVESGLKLILQIAADEPQQ